MNFIEKLKKYILQNNDFNIVNINGSYADEKKKTDMMNSRILICLLLQKKKTTI